MATLRPLGVLTSLHSVSACCPHVGQPARVTVDGVSQALVGKLSYISPRAEYTPPVIYSRESRSKLVFMIEIRFEPDAARNLHPGQPVDVAFQTGP